MWNQSVPFSCLRFLEMAAIPTGAETQKWLKNIKFYAINRLCYAVRWQAAPARV
jgi:hypothetical protein